MEKLVSIVTPFYNESESIESYFSEVTAVLEGKQLELVCVDD